MFRWILLFVFVAVVEIYAFQALRTVTKLRWLLWAYQGISLFIILYIAYSFTQFDRSVGQNKQSLFTIGLLLITFVPKMIIASMMILEDVTRIIGGLMREFLGDSNESFFSERRKFVSQIALGLAAIPFLSLLYGVTKGKYNFKVRKKTIYFPDLPENFDGLTITQISDVHSGSFDDPDEISHAINLINEQKSDIVLFTGDIVNTHAHEMHPWVDTFKRIETPTLGKYSVLGNHDYGEYVTWNTEKEKQDNFEAIKDLHRQIDFKLLLNENVKINKDGQEIALVGVENWGHNFKKAGDLPKASKGLTPEDFKILMSHDPSHWEYEVKDNANNYHLTLSGHTHGLQFGIEIPGFIKWSPVQYVYKQWAGLYEKTGRYIYVNRGFGFHAYPGRVGIWPEITVLELKKGQKIA
ncbi:metallophosphoesterase [Flavobacterium arcticum]|uniref:Metallophosphoesterase n=1 Tax=Flavobacterium arcticum TaxID=1784713 RepID=A0A345HA06_9FLAO|nr:metallophosphoesterase [Flavobacterium arcticum]AXG73416.1 metallophosphoesterase [Flavobacterium arcticum]KAF2513203.1 metallophosphoesterase [Flavobacterium arcticum]